MPILSQECQCCFKDIQDKTSLHICNKNHVICHECQQRMGRTDCLFCQPHTNLHNQSRIHIAPEFEVIQLPRRPRRPPSRPPSCLEETLFGTVVLILYLARIVAIFLGLAYLGKVFIYFYLWLNPETDYSWFGWDRFRYIIGEAFLGVAVLLILVGCGVGIRSWVFFLHFLTLF